MPLKVYVFGLAAVYDIKSTIHEYSDLLEDDLREGIFSNISHLHSALENSFLINDKVKTINFLGYEWTTNNAGGRANEWEICVTFRILLAVHSSLDEPKIKRHIHSQACYEIVQNWFKGFNIGEVNSARNTSINNFLAYTSYYPSP